MTWRSLYELIIRIVRWTARINSVIKFGDVRPIIGTMNWNWIIYVAMVELKICERFKIANRIVIIILRGLLKI